MDEKLVYRGVEFPMKKWSGKTKCPFEDCTVTVKGKDGLLSHISSQHAQRIELTCLNCKETFEVNNPDRKFCSMQCLNGYKDEQQTTYDKTCKNCGREFEVTPSRKGKVFCDQECYNQYRRRSTAKKTCKNCGEEFEYYPSKQAGVFCSHECHMEHMRET